MVERMGLEPIEQAVTVSVPATPHIEGLVPAVGVEPTYN
jgi:hypothetical protein